MVKKRQIITEYLKKHGTVAIATLLSAVSLSKSAWYYPRQRVVMEQQKKKQQEKDIVITNINKVLVDMSYYGYRRVTKQLKRNGYSYNHKRIRKVMGEYLLLQPRKSKSNYPKTTDSRHKYRVYTNEIKCLGTVLPRDVWVSDITYVWTGRAWAYLAIVLDQASRKVVGYSFDTTMTKKLATDALRVALKHHGKPRYHHSDRGSQYCSHEYIDILYDYDITPSMTDVGLSVDNPHAESFNRSIKVEEVYPNMYESFEDARSGIENYILVYNEWRLHSSLGYRSPVEFEKDYYQSSEVE